MQAGAHVCGHAHGNRAVAGGCDHVVLVQGIHFEIDVTVGCAESNGMPAWRIVQARPNPTIGGLGLKGTLHVLGVHAAIGGGEVDVALHIFHLDAAVGGVRIHVAVHPAQVNGSVRSRQVSVAIDVVHSEGAIRAGDVFERRLARDSNDVLRAHVSVVRIGPGSLYADGVARARSFNVHGVEQAFTLGVFGARDIDGVLVPTCDVDGAVCSF